MSSQFMQHNRIRKYLQIPFVMFIMLIVMNIVIYAMDTRAGAVVTIFIVLYLCVLLLMYVHYKPAIMAEMIAFAFEQGKVQKELLKELGVPYILIDTAGKPLWANKGFFDIVGGEKNARRKTLFQLFPDMTGDRLPITCESSEMVLLYEERCFRVEMKRVCLQSALATNQPATDKKNELEAVMDEHDMMIAVYFFDETKFQNYIRENQEQKLVVGQIYIDNYEEAMDSVEEVRQPLLVALIDRKINVYMQNIDAIVKKMEKDKYFFIFKQKYLPQLETTKFALLDEVRAIQIGNELAVTLSISIGAQADSFQQAYDYARVAMDLALGRGGDQAVLSDIPDGKAKSQFLINAAEYYIDHFGKEAFTEARNEVIRLLGGVIAGCTNLSALPQRAVTEEVKQEEEPQDDNTISDYALSYLMDGMEE